MAKLYLLCGYFLIGLSLFGSLGYAIKTIPKLSDWSISLIGCTVLIVLVLIIVTDLLTPFLEISKVEYIGWLILILTTVIIGVFLQAR